MKYRTLGSTGLSVSVLGLGTWQFGGEWGIDFTQGQVDAIIDKAGECGINLIDTAECYGDHLAEKLIGDYFSRHERDGWLIASKFGHHFHGFLQREDSFEPASVLKQLDDSLRHLQVEKIDLYQFHSGPDIAFRNEALWTMLDKQKAAGKIGYLGASLNKSTEIQADEASAYGVEVLQVLYNRLDRRSETFHFPYAKRDHLGVLARVPLASGLLSGKYHKGAVFPDNDVRSRQTKDSLQAQLDEVERIKLTELPEGIPMAQWAMAWCLQRSEVTCVIPGCKTPEQVEANAGAARWVL